MLVFGHRGASFDAPENTIGSILEALKQGADGVEIDVRRNRNDNFSVIHDATFTRTTGEKGRVSNSSNKRISTLDAGTFKSARYKGEKIPILAEVLDIVPSGKLLQIELKSSIRSVPRLAYKIRSSRKHPSEIIVIGFSYYAMQLVKELLPNVKVAWINGEKSQFQPNMQPVSHLIRKLQMANLDAVDFDSRFDIKEEYVKRVKSSGYEMYSWTVDDIERAKYFKSIGISGIATNRPRYIINGLNEK